MIGLIIGLSILGVLVLFGLILFLFDRFYSKIFSHRGDGSNSIIYNNPSDYSHLDIRDGYFETRKRFKLHYVIYKNMKVDIKATLLVVHGVGFGHQYLLPMIERFCNDGYLVIAYDQFASGASEGRAIKTMTTALKDISYVLKFIKENNELSKYPLYVFGHSWGGFVSFSSLKYSTDIKKAASISGFYNESSFSPKIGLLIKLRNFFYVGKDAFFDNRKVVKKSKAKMLYMQGRLDGVINPRFAGEKYEKLSKINQNLTVELLDKKGHTPYNDDESQAAQDKVLGEFGLLGGVLVPINHYVDFRKISKVDDVVYKRIIDFYNN